jgi:DNA-binding XRE family transcriptional regulator
METVTISRDEYEDLLDNRAYLLAKQREEAGLVVRLTHEEATALLDEPHPLAFWRKRAGMTQAELAQALDVSQPYIAQIETGRRLGDVHLYVRAAKFFGVQIEDVIPAPAGTSVSP